MEAEPEEEEEVRTTVREAWRRKRGLGDPEVTRVCLAPRMVVRRRNAAREEVSSWRVAGEGVAPEGGAWPAVLGDEAGRLTVVDAAGGEAHTVETPEGSAVRSLLWSPPRWEGGPDLVAGSSDGGLAVFSCGRVLSRASLSRRVCVLAEEVHANSDRLLVAGDARGHFRGVFHEGGAVWSAMAPVELPLRCAAACSVGGASCVAVGGRGPGLALLARGVPVGTVALPAPAAALARGRVRAGRGEELLAACTDGRVYHAAEAAAALCEAGHPLTGVAAVPLGDGLPDLVACAGHFGGLRVFCGGALVAAPGGEWVHSLDACGAGSPGHGTIVAASHDGDVVAYEVCRSVSSGT